MMYLANLLNLLTISLNASYSVLCKMHESASKHYHKIQKHKRIYAVMLINTFNFAPRRIRRRQPQPKGSVRLVCVV